MIEEEGHNTNLGLLFIGAAIHNTRSGSLFIIRRGSLFIMRRGSLFTLTKMKWTKAIKNSSFCSLISIVSCIFIFHSSPDININFKSRSWINVPFTTNRIYDWWCLPVSFSSTSAKHFSIEREPAMNSSAWLMRCSVKDCVDMNTELQLFHSHCSCSWRLWFLGIGAILQTPKRTKRSWLRKAKVRNMH